MGTRRVGTGQVDSLPQSVPLIRHASKVESGRREQYLGPD
jgi:hypothetical protein